MARIRKQSQLRSRARSEDQTSSLQRDSRYNRPFSKEAEMLIPRKEDIEAAVADNGRAIFAAKAAVDALRKGVADAVAGEDEILARTPRFMTGVRYRESQNERDRAEIRAIRERREQSGILKNAFTYMFDAFRRSRLQSTIQTRENEQEQITRRRNEVLREVRETKEQAIEKYKEIVERHAGDNADRLTEFFQLATRFTETHSKADYLRLQQFITTENEMLESTWNRFAQSAETASEIIVRKHQLLTEAVTEDEKRRIQTELNEAVENRLKVVRAANGIRYQRDILLTNALPFLNVPHAPLPEIVDRAEHVYQYRECQIHSKLKKDSWQQFGDLSVLSDFQLLKQLYDCTEEEMAIRSIQLSQLKFEGGMNIWEMGQPNLLKLSHFDAAAYRTHSDGKKQLNESLFAWDGTANSITQKFLPDVLERLKLAREKREYLIQLALARGITEQQIEDFRGQDRSDRRIQKKKELIEKECVAKLAKARYLGIASELERKTETWEKKVLETKGGRKFLREYRSLINQFNTLERNVRNSMAVSNELANKHNKLIAVEKLTSQIEQLQLQIRTFMSEHEEMMRAHGELRDGLSFDSVINLERKVQELQAQYQECQTEKEQLEGRLHSTSESLARQESTLSEIRGEIGSAQMAARLNKVEEYLGKSVEDASDAMSVLQAFSSLSEDAPKLFDIERTGLFLEFNSILVQEFARAASLAASGEDPRSSLHFRNRTATSEFDVPTNNAVIASRDVINNSFEALKEKYGTDEWLRTMQAVYVTWDSMVSELGALNSDFTTTLLRTGKLSEFSIRSLHGMSERVQELRYETLPTLLSGFAKKLLVKLEEKKPSIFSAQKTKDKFGSDMEFLERLTKTPPLPMLQNDNERKRLLELSLEFKQDELAQIFFFIEKFSIDTEQAFVALELVRAKYNHMEETTAQDEAIEDIQKRIDDCEATIRQSRTDVANTTGEINSTERQLLYIERQIEVLTSDQLKALKEDLTKYSKNEIVRSILDELGSQTESKSIDKVLEKLNALRAECQLSPEEMERINRHHALLERFETTKQKLQVLRQGATTEIQDLTREMESLQHSLEIAEQNLHTAHVGDGANGELHTIYDPVFLSSIKVGDVITEANTPIYDVRHASIVSEIVITDRERGIGYIKTIEASHVYGHNVTECVHTHESWKNAKVKVFRPKPVMNGTEIDEIATQERAQKAVDFAKAQVGKPYTFGYVHLIKGVPSGEDTSQWYCSQLTWAAYLEQGLDIYSTREGQIQQHGFLIPAELEDGKRPNIELVCEYDASRVLSSEAIFYDGVGRTLEAFDQTAEEQQSDLNEQRSLYKNQVAQLRLQLATLKTSIKRNWHSIEERVVPHLMAIGVQISEYPEISSRFQDQSNDVFAEKINEIRVLFQTDIDEIEEMERSLPSQSDLDNSDDFAMDESLLAGLRTRIRSVQTSDKSLAQEQSLHCLERSVQHWASDKILTCIDILEPLTQEGQNRRNQLDKKDLDFVKTCLLDQLMETSCKVVASEDKKQLWDQVFSEIDVRRPLLKLAQEATQIMEQIKEIANTADSLRTFNDRTSNLRNRLEEQLFAMEDILNNQPKSSIYESMRKTFSYAANSWIHHQRMLMNVVGSIASLSRSVDERTMQFIKHISDLQANVLTTLNVQLQQGPTFGNSQCPSTDLAISFKDSEEFKEFKAVAATIGKFSKGIKPASDGARSQNYTKFLFNTADEELTHAGMMSHEQMRTFKPVLKWFFSGGLRSFAHEIRRTYKYKLMIPSEDGSTMVPTTQELSYKTIRTLQMKKMQDTLHALLRCSEQALKSGVMKYEEYVTIAHRVYEFDKKFTQWNVHDVKITTAFFEASAWRHMAAQDSLMNEMLDLYVNVNDVVNGATRLEQTISARIEVELVDREIIASRQERYSKTVAGVTGALVFRDFEQEAERKKHEEIKFEPNHNLENQIIEYFLARDEKNSLLQRISQPGETETSGVLFFEKLLTNRLNDFLKDKTRDQKSQIWKDLFEQKPRDGADLLIRLSMVDRIELAKSDLVSEYGRIAQELMLKTDPAEITQLESLLKDCETKIDAMETASSYLCTLWGVKLKTTVVGKSSIAEERNADRLKTETLRSYSFVEANDRTDLRRYLESDELFASLESIVPEEREEYKQQIMRSFGIEEKTIDEQIVSAQQQLDTAKQMLADKRQERARIFRENSIDPADVETISSMHIGEDDTGDVARNAVIDSVYTAEIKGRLAHMRRVVEQMNNLIPDDARNSNSEIASRNQAIRAGLQQQLDDDAAHIRRTADVMYGILSNTSYDSVDGENQGHDGVGGESQEHIENQQRFKQFRLKLIEELRIEVEIEILEKQMSVVRLEEEKSQFVSWLDQETAQVVEAQRKLYETTQEVGLLVAAQTTLVGNISRALRNAQTAMQSGVEHLRIAEAYQQGLNPRYTGPSSQTSIERGRPVDIGLDISTQYLRSTGAHLQEESSQPARQRRR